jgi:outer membrane protein TolC
MTIRIVRNKALFVLLYILHLSAALHAQGWPDTSIHLKDAVLIAEQRYHLLKSKQEEVNAAIKDIEVVKYSRVPSIDVSYQAGYGTANNLTGIFYPGYVLPMTGPPSVSNNYSGGTGSAASALLNWQASTFGQRNAAINVSIAAANSTQSELQQFIFEHKINVLSTYLDLLLAYDVVSVHQHNIERVQASLHQSRVLAATGIKPGVDTALFLSELSKAKIDWLSAKRLLQVNQLLLQQLIVTNALPVPADTAFLNNLPAPAAPADSSFSNAPVVKSIQNQLMLSQSKEEFLKRSFLPKLNVWASGFARGSAFQANGDIKTWDGMGLSRYNYGAGLQLSFPIMKYGEVRKLVQQQEFLSKATWERLEDRKLALSTQQNIAIVTYNNAMAIAAETGRQLQSGQYAFSAMQTRYNTGLVTFSDLVQAQYNLLKAELDVKKSYCEVWKALLLQAAIKGDETIFLNEIR